MPIGLGTQLVHISPKKQLKTSFWLCLGMSKTNKKWGKNSQVSRLNNIKNSPTASTICRTLTKLMGCMNMLKQKHYAHERRAKDRNKKQMKERLHIQLIIEEFLSQEKLQQAQQSQNFPELYNQVIQHLEQQKVSFSLKKSFY